MRGLTLSAYSFKTPRQRVLAGMLVRDFAEYRRRDQLWYELEGMSTAHITLHVLKSPEVLAEFWPDDNRRFVHTTQRALRHDVGVIIEKVQDAVRTTLNQLSEVHITEKVGNEHERRWRLHKSLWKELT